jgi:Kelch motif
MKKTCFQDNCKKRVAFVCNCTQNPTYSCDKHFGKHAMSKGDHSSQNSLLIFLDSKDSQNLYLTLKETQEKLEKLTNSVIAETKSLIQKITKESRQLINHIRIKELKITELIKSLGFDSIIDKEDLDEITQISEARLIESSKESLDKEISNFYDFNNRFYLKDFLCFFKGNSQNLTIVSIDKPDFVIPLNIPNNFDLSSGHCELPNNKQFFYGGGFNSNINRNSLFAVQNSFGQLYRTSSVGNAYIIDIEKQQAIQKKSSNFKSYIGCCYFKNKIYVFGGQNDLGIVLNDTEEYDLSTDSWKNLSPLPIVCRNGTCFTSKDDIVYAGALAPCIIFYSVPKNNYKQYGNFSPQKMKILCNYENKSYLFEAEKLYKTTDSNWSGYTVINYNTNLPNSYFVAYGTLKDKNFYFVLGNNHLYKFDFKTESVVLLRLV